MCYGIVSVTIITAVLGPCTWALYLFDVRVRLWTGYSIPQDFPSKELEQESKGPGAVRWRKCCQ